MPRHPQRKVDSATLFYDGSQDWWWSLLLSCEHYARREIDPIRTYDKSARRERTLGVALPPTKMACMLCPAAK